jgi:DNA polymerase-3 subunit gamma/tau
MRDALSLTDQAIAYAAGKVTEESVRGMLGTLDDAYLIRILDCLISKDGASLLAGRPVRNVGLHGEERL